MGAMIKAEIKKLPQSEVEITAEIPAIEFESYRKDAVKKLSKNIDVQGFRKGHAPEDVLIKKVGDMVVLEEMAERAIGKAYPEILAENKIDAIGQPQVTITKIAKGENLGFKLTTAVMPEVKLGDYKKVAKGISAIEEIKVEDKEVEDVIEQVRKQRRQTAKNDADEDADKNAETSASETGNSASDQRSNQRSISEISKAPELTDKFVQTLGEFKTVDEIGDHYSHKGTWFPVNQLPEKTVESHRKRIIPCALGAFVAENTQICI